MMAVERYIFSLGLQLSGCANPGASHVAAHMDLFSKFLPGPYLHQAIKSTPMHQRAPPPPPIFAVLLGSLEEPSREIKVQ